MKTPLQRLREMAAPHVNEVLDETDRCRVVVCLGDVRALLAIVEAAESVALADCADCYKTSAAINKLRTLLGIKERP